MSDLDQRIAQWRRSLSQAEAVTANDLDELETHLRAAQTELAGQGLSEEEAFWLAERRLGHPKAIAAEYAKENPAALWGTRMLWMMAGYLAISVLLGGLHAAAQLAAVIGFMGGLRGLGAAVLYVSAQCIGYVLAYWGVKSLVSRGIPSLAARWQPFLSSLRHQRALAAAVMMTLAVVGVRVANSLLSAWQARWNNPVDLGYYYWDVAHFNAIAAIVIPLMIIRLIFWARRQSLHLAAKPAAAK